MKKFVFYGLLMGIPWLCIASDGEIFDAVKNALQGNNFELAKQRLGTNPSESLVFYTDAEGNTLLHYAVRQRAIEVAETLVKSGASSFKKNNKNETPLVLAIQNGLMHLVNKVMLPIRMQQVKELREEIMRGEEKRETEETPPPVPPRVESLQPSPPPPVPPRKETMGGRPVVEEVQGATVTWPHTKYILSKEERDELDTMDLDRLSDELESLQSILIKTQKQQTREAIQAKLEYMTQRIKMLSSTPLSAAVTPESSQQVPPPPPPPPLPATFEESKKKAAAVERPTGEMLAERIAKGLSKPRVEVFVPSKKEQWDTMKSNGQLKLLQEELKRLNWADVQKELIKVEEEELKRPSKADMKKSLAKINEAKQIKADLEYVRKLEQELVKEQQLIQEQPETEEEWEV